MASFNFNKVILGGRLTSDPELKTTPNGVSVATFSVAVNRKAKSDTEVKADFINCVAWRGTAEFISKYFHKGNSICVVGSIQTRNWIDNNNQKRYATEVSVDEVTFVDSKNDGSSAPAPTYNPTAHSDTTQFEELAGDEDLPF